MNAEVYYFTGTGNSLAVAKELSEKLRAENTNAVLVPVPSAIRKAAVKPEAEIVASFFLSITSIYRIW